MELAKQLSKPKAARSALLSDRSFLCLWLSSIGSGLAFSMYLLLESWYVVKQLNMENRLGLVMMATTIPRVLLLAVGGVWADRLRRSLIMSFLGFSRAILVILMAVLIPLGLLHFGLLLAFALSFGVLDAFYWPANSSLLPRIVKKEQLVQANAFVQTSQQLTFLIGPAASGLLLKAGSYSLAFLVIAGILILSGGVVSRMKEEHGASVAERKPLWREMKAGMAYVRGVPYLIVTMATSIVVNMLLVGPINAGLPVFAKHVLDGDVLALSWLESALAGGMIAGGVLIGLLNVRRKRAVLSLGLIGMMGIFDVLFSQTVSIWQGMALLALVGACVSISNIIGPAVSQPMIERSMLGRVQSLMNTASFGLTPVSYAVVSALLSSGVAVTSIILYANIALVAFVGFILLRVRIVWSID